MRKFDCGALSRWFQKSVTQFPHCCGYCDVAEGEKYFFSSFYWHRALKICHRSFPLDQSRQQCDDLMSVLGKPTTKCESRGVTADDRYMRNELEKAQIPHVRQTGDRETRKVGFK